jgi:hypothetical protein
MRTKVSRAQAAKADGRSVRRFAEAQKNDAARRTELRQALERGEITLENFRDKAALLIPPSIVDGAGRHYFWADELEARQRAQDKQRAIADYVEQSAAVTAA